MRIEDYFRDDVSRKPNTPKKDYRTFTKTVRRIWKVIPTLHPQSHQL